VKLLHDRRLWWVVAGLTAAAAVAASLLPMRDWSEALELSMHHHTMAVALAIFCAAYVAGTLLMLPAWIFPVAAGAAFGFWWGLLAAVASSAVAALAAFLIGRFVVRERIEGAAKRDPAFKAVEASVKREPFTIVMLLRMSPVLPSGLKSYFLGVTSLDLVPYLVASAVGMLPGNLLKVWLGQAGHDAVHANSTQKWAVLALGIGATVAVAFIVGRMARKRLGL
jgi:uncharacterized membrane protein YdjX (TVP38/TMEM64 family)